MEKDYKKTKQFHSCFSVAGVYIVIYALGLGFICNLLSRSTSLFFYIPWEIEWILEWPIGIITSLIPASIIVATHWTTVSISDAMLNLKVRGKKVDAFPLEKVILHREQKNQYETKSYLRVFNPSGTSQDYKLHYFSASRHAALLQHIDVSKRKNIPDEIIAEHNLERFSSETTLITWPKKLISQAGRKLYLLIGAIFLAVFLILFFLADPLTFNIMAPIICIICIGVLIYLCGAWPFLLFNEKRCLHTLKIGYQWLQINGQSFKLANIQSLSITSIQKKNDSIFPVQRYLKVFSNGTKYVYWLGFDIGVTYEEYQTLTNILDAFFETTPAKLQKKG